jgi:hypothetical protein
MIVANLATTRQVVAQGSYMPDLGSGRVMSRQQRSGGVA